LKEKIVRRPSGLNSLIAWNKRTPKTKRKKEPKQTNFQKHKNNK